MSAKDAPEGTPNEPHPFHVHTNPFEVVEIEHLRSNVAVPIHEWRDTIAIEPGKKTTIRIRFRDFAGPVVFHCHTLDHGDQGMMRTIQVVDPSRPDAGGLGPVAKLTDCAVPAPALSLTTAEGASVDLQSLAGRNVVLVFFRGMACPHCVRQLRSLLECGRELFAQDTSIVAVSAAPIADPEQALNWLNLPAGLDFRLLVDEQHVGFRAFGCYDDGPQHGLFLIDKSRTIVACYSGPKPLDDVPDVWARIQKLRTREHAGGLSLGAAAPPQFDSTTHYEVRQ